jgi:O-methyltransferase/aklanonic acid methyltransferase
MSHHTTDTSGSSPKDDDEELDAADATAQKRLIADFYSRIATSYDQVGPAVFSRFGELVVKVAGIHEGARVLDVGAGRGASLFPAAAAAGVTGQVVGIDLAPAMVEETARAIAQSGLTNAGIELMDAEHLTFVDASFDYVLCSFAYFFFPHLKRALAHFFRVLRPGGTLLLTTRGPHDEYWSWYERRLVATYQEYGLPLPLLGGEGHRDLSDLHTLLGQTGFTAIRDTPEEVEAIYADAGEWWAAKWSHGARRLLEQMPPEILPRFVAETQQQLAPLRKADGFHERWRIICVLGTRPLI